MTRHFIPGIDDEYKFTRPEYALFIGISTNALRMKMRRGFYSGEYVIKNGKYLFKRPRPQHDNGPPSDHPKSMVNVSAYSIKRTRNRGNHKEGDTSNYTNDAFRMHNEMKMLNKLNGKFKTEEHKKRFEQLNDAALKKINDDIAKEDDQKFKTELSRDPGAWIVTGKRTKISKKLDAIAGTDVLECVTTKNDDGTYRHHIHSHGVWVMPKHDIKKIESVMRLHQIGRDQVRACTEKLITPDYGDAWMLTAPQRAAVYLAKYLTKVKGSRS